MANEDTKEFGKRVQFYRKKLGLSQSELASRIGRSETWLSQVERGVRRIDRMSVLDKLSDALDVPLSELLPESEVISAATSQQPEVARNMALALSSSSALRAVLSDRPDADVHRLDDVAERAWGFAHRSSYEQLALLLTDAIPEIEGAIRVATGDDLRRICVAAARIYHAASAVLAKLGEGGAAWVAVDRAISLAEQADEPLLMGEGAFRLALVFQALRRFDLAYQSASTALSALEDDEELGFAEALSVRGALSLQLAVIAARQNQADDAYSWLAHARSLAGELGEDRNDYNTEFGPTNVYLHEVAVAIELGDAGRALRVADGIDVALMSPERQGRLLIDVARAHGQLRQTAGLIEALSAALTIAPEQVKTHRLVRELIMNALSGDARTSPELRKLAERLALETD